MVAVPSGSKRVRGLLWALWLLYAAAWTAALLTTFPIEARNAVLTEEYHFPAGKTLHVVGYAVFAALTAFLPVRLPWQRGLLVLVLLHAALSEFLQQFVGRTPELTDVGLDLIGISLGVLLTWKRWR